MDSNRYDPVTQALHWATALAIVGAYSITLIVEDMARGPAKTQLMGLHMSLGVTVFALTALRLSWRVLAAKPLPANGPSMMVLAAKMGHLALYALMVVVPVIGMTMVWAKGREIGFFGLFTLPPLIGPDRELAEFLEETHELVGNALIALAGIHAAVAIFHQVVLRDGTLARMVPGLGARSA